MDIIVVSELYFIEILVLNCPCNFVVIGLRKYKTEAANEKKHACDFEYLINFNIFF